MIRIIICDDDKKWLEHSAAALRSFTESKEIEASISTYESPDDIPGFGTEADASRTEPAPDIVFMDIEFERTERGDSNQTSASGINAAAEFNRTYPDCKIVYVTNYLNYVIDVYHTDHIWYVIKDQFEERLPEIFDKLRQIDEDRRSELILNESGRSQTRIRCNDITYIERRDRHTIIRTDKGDHTIHQRIPEIEDKLPADSFGRCHTSFIVNFEKVASIADRSLRMDDGAEILISRGYSKSFRIKYMDWAGSRSVR